MRFRERRTGREIVPQMNVDSVASAIGSGDFGNRAVDRTGFSSIASPLPMST